MSTKEKFLIALIGCAILAGLMSSCTIGSNSDNHVRIVKRSANTWNGTEMIRVIEYVQDSLTYYDSTATGRDGITSYHVISSYK